MPQIISHLTLILILVCSKIQNSKFKIQNDELNDIPFEFSNFEFTLVPTSQSCCSPARYAEYVPIDSSGNPGTLPYLQPQ